MVWLTLLPACWSLCVFVLNVFLPLGCELLNDVAFVCVLCVGVCVCFNMFVCFVCDTLCGVVCKVFTCVC